MATLLTDEELEVVLAHEYAHLACHHSARFRSFFSEGGLSSASEISMLSIQQENEADAWALDITKNPRAFISAGIKMFTHIHQQGNLEAYALDLRITHPGIIKRICLAYRKIMQR